MKPGLYDDVSETTYHQGEESLSSTFARLLTRHVPAKAFEIRRNRKPTRAMNLGKAVHTHALGVGPELVVWEHDGRTTEGKQERAAWSFLIEDESAVAVTEAERDQIDGMVKALRADPIVRIILDECQAEVSGFWQENGVDCRARYDLLGTIEAFDYKSTQDVSLRGFSKSMASYGYHQQADWYLRGLRALGHPAADRPLRFICQETEPPYLVQIHTPDEMAMQTARLLNDRAIRIYAAAVASGVWPGYPSIEAPETASLPNYYFYDIEDALPDEWRVLPDQIEVSA